MSSLDRKYSRLQEQKQSRQRLLGLRKRGFKTKLDKNGKEVEVAIQKPYAKENGTLAEYNRYVAGLRYVKAPKKVRRSKAVAKPALFRRLLNWIKETFDRREVGLVDKKKRMSVDVLNKVVFILLLFFGVISSAYLILYFAGDPETRSGLETSYLIVIIWLFIALFVIIDSRDKLKKELRELKEKKD